MHCHEHKRDTESRGKAKACSTEDSGSQLKGKIDTCMTKGTCDGDMLAALRRRPLVRPLLNHKDPLILKTSGQAAGYSEYPSLNSPCVEI